MTENETVSDLSELCRLCLEQSTVLIPFETSCYFTTKSIPELIRYCLDINCNIKDDGILPKKLCQSCLEKLQSTFEFKYKSKESEKYLNEILLSNTSEVDVEEPEITPYNPAPSYFASGEEDDLLEPVDDFQDKSSKLGAPPVQLGEVMREVRGQRLGNFMCQFCDKSFRYVKAFNTHIKQHKRGEICKSGNKRRYTLKRKKPVPEENTYAIEAPDEPMEEEDEEQAPYDSLSPYGSPARFEQPAREDSPDLGMMMLNSFHNGDNGTSETPKRMRKQRLQPAELSPEVEIPEKVQPRPSTSGGTRGRGRPRKDQVRAKPEQAEMEEPSPFADFCEVDVSRVLKKSIFDNDSYSQSAASTTRSRSRSASVELIDDVDIFGSVLPDSGAAKPKPKSAVSMTFTCSEPECGKKFHLRANLKKHLREVHGSI